MYTNPPSSLKKITAGAGCDYQSSPGSVVVSGTVYALAAASSTWVYFRRSSTAAATLLINA